MYDAHCIFTLLLLSRLTTYLKTSVKMESFFIQWVTWPTIRCT